MNEMKQIQNVKRNLLLLFCGRFVSDFGTALFKFSLSLYVLDVTGSAALYSLILTLTILPGIFISILAGTLIDKYDKKKIIFIADLLSSVSAGILFIFIECISDNLFVFGLGVVLVSFIQTFLNLGINSGVANMVPADMVPKANAYFQAMGAILTILGPVIGAVCYGAFGIKMVLLIDAVTYGIGAATTLLIEFMYNKSGEETEFNIKEGVKYIFSYVKKYSAVKMLMIMLFALTFVYYPLTNVALQNIMRLNVKATEFQLSYAVAAVGVGVIIGALASSMQKLEKALSQLPRKLFALSFLVLLWSIPILIYLRNALSSQRNTIITVVFIIILVCMGFVYTRIVIPAYSYMQMYVDENVRGRVFGLATSALNIAAPLGLVIYGFLLELNIELIVIALSAFILFVFAIKMFARIREQGLFKEQ
ncbi:putative MFS family arabinose efflux permease [Ruminiclostridium sufflavum DSM 19573]|uniref:Putative MFS family arabinose efflux permease n=1 Tax=Ruminiclostridium sufflavum DSM 19573 TaxID=1121337 RepID=A0A318XKR0_9FIRM|nr:MFS transporter [Ruminiclostridium sufflavum]PYG88040.1 putative MFS family arabinose efflux permease [Ruminiclostridium sufflavum DSM 19573]